MTTTIKLQSLKTFAKRFARMKRMAHHDALDFVASRLGQPHWNALATAWDNGWRPKEDAIDTLASIEEASDPVMDIPMLGIGDGVEEQGEIDGHPYSLRIDFEVIVAQTSWWCIHMGQAPSARPIIEVYNMTDANPIFDHAFRKKALAICMAGVERLQARISADWPRRSTKPDADGQVQHPLLKGVAAQWYCLHCDGAFTGAQMAENMWHCPTCSANPLDIFPERFWDAA